MGCLLNFEGSFFVRTSSKFELSTFLSEIALYSLEVMAWTPIVHILGLS